MSDFKFTCPHCTQHIAGDEALRGQKIPCPGCGHDITVPRAFGLEPEPEPATEVSPIPPSEKSFSPVLKKLAVSALIWLVAVSAAVVICVQLVKRNNEKAAAAAALANKPMTNSLVATMSPELAAADKKVRDQLPAVIDAVKNYNTAVKKHDEVQRANRDKTTDDAAQQIKSAEDALDAASAAMSTAYKNLDAAIDDYHKLGGTTDYRRFIK
jgi:hypothetical protein